MILHEMFDMHAVLMWTIKEFPICGVYRVGAIKDCLHVLVGGGHLLRVGQIFDAIGDCSMVDIRWKMY